MGSIFAYLEDSKRSSHTVAELGKGIGLYELAQFTPPK